MDYLYYVEHEAESLQFFLWYYDYMQRWSKLLPRQKALSPPCHPENVTEPDSRFISYSHKRARSDKMNKIISIMEMSQRDNEEPVPPPQSYRGRKRSLSISSTATNHPRTPSSALLSPAESVKTEWQPCKALWAFKRDVAGFC